MIRSSLRSCVIRICEKGDLNPEKARERRLEKILPTGIILEANAKRPNVEYIISLPTVICHIGQDPPACSQHFK